MREILFRGKGINDGKWVEGGIIQGVPHDLWQNGDKAYIMVFPKYLSKPNLYEVDPFTVGQYTGLTDKNGKRIFEGDVCQIKNHRLIGDLPFVIEWEDFAYNGWTWRDLDEVGAVDSFTNGAARHCEVIGNIHDNPELLKEEPT